MAKTTKIDELNILDYISAMNLPQEEINKRISLALKVKEMYEVIFEEIKRSYKLWNEIEEDYIEDMLKNGYREFLFDDEYHEQYIDEISKEVAQTTVKHIGDEYYLSEKRATVIAVNDANSIRNYEYEQEFKAKGYKKKRWDTMQDERVRHTHVMADGQEVGIDDMFSVGMCKMRFPMDAMYGNADEIVNCRCVCQYLSGV